MKGLVLVVCWMYVFPSPAQRRDFDKYLESGKHKIEQAEFTGALIDFSSAISARPKAPDGYYWRGLTYYYLGKSQEALADYNAAIEVDPKFTPALFERGYMLLLIEEYEISKDDFLAIVKIDHTNALAWYNLGLCRYYLNDLLGAVQAYNETLVLDSTYLSAWYNRGIAKYYLTDYTGCLKDMQRAAALDSTHVNSYHYIGLCHYNSFNNIEAIRAFTQVIALDPAFKEAYYNRGLAAYYEKQYKDAVEDFNIVIELDPSDLEAVYRRGLALSALGLKSESLKDFEYVVSEDPTFELARKELEFLRKQEMPKVNSAQKRLPQIWAVIIGISEYADQSMNLKYANKDAEALYTFFTSPSGGQLDSEHVILLTDKQATRANIIKAMSEKFYKAFETDMIILFIASHGQPDPVGNEVYFLGYDTDKGNLSGTGVSQLDIEKIFSRSNAGKKIWLADACHSGGAGLNTGVRKGEDAALVNRLLMQMAIANKGMAMLTASSSSEYSYEDGRWGGGHGVFSYYLLEGLAGKADANGNKIVEIRELYEYVYRHVSSDTNGKQHPELKGNFDNELPLSVLKE